MNELCDPLAGNCPQSGQGGPGGVEALMTALGSDDGPARRDARLALVGAGFRSTPALLAGLDASDAGLRWEAAKALSEIRDPRAAPGLAQALEDDSPGVRWIAAEGLEALGPDALTALLEALVQRPPDALLLEGAHRVLHGLDEGHRLPAAARPVLAALEGPAPDLAVPPAAQTALWALAGREGPAALPQLAVHFEKNDGNQEMKGASKMLIAMHAEVNCTDGMAGHCSHVIVDPADLKVTHLVVGKNERPPRPQRPPRLVLEESELPVVLKRPHLTVEERPDAETPRPPRLQVEEDEHRATIPVPHVEVKEDESWDSQRLVPWEKVVKTALVGIRLDCAQHEFATLEDFVERRYIQVGVPDYHNAGEFGLFTKVPEEVKWVEVTEERVPQNEVAINHRTRVEATDGEVGRVGALVVEPGSGRITHLVLDQGLPWDQRDVIVPAAHISRMGEGMVHLKLDRQGVAALPAL